MCRKAGECISGRQGSGLTLVVWKRSAFDDLRTVIPFHCKGDLRGWDEGDEAATKNHFKDGYFYPGDLAIARSDGRIALQGRSTDIINVLGRKIFPGPVEDHLCESLDVSGACLFSMQNRNGEEELYVAIETAVPISDERLRAALDGALKVRAYPRANVFYFPSLPRNPMGKVLRQAVRDGITAHLSRRT